MNPHEIRRIAVEAMTDPRTVKNYMLGKTVKDLSAARIDAAITRLEKKETAKK